MKVQCRLLSALLLTACVLLSACGGGAKESSTATTAPSESVTTQPVATEPVVIDPYSVENRYDIPESYFAKQSGVDYGTVLKDVTYYSAAAGDNKQCNILLPAGYDESQTYPVLYIFHGFGGSHNNQIDTDSYVTLLYGNLLHDGKALPMILVNADMYTDKQADKKDKTKEELRYSYDKAITDMAQDLMPYIEQHYPVKTGRQYTAIAGMSEGGAKALCTGFQWLDRFGYIAGFAPDWNVIPIGEDYMDSFWTVPYFPDGLPQPTDETMPYYVYMAVGSNDPYNIESTLYYRDILTDMGVQNQTDYVEGYEHDYIFWGQCFYNYLSKIFKSQ